MNLLVAKRSESVVAANPQESQSRHHLWDGGVDWVTANPFRAVYRHPGQSDRDYRAHGSRFPAVCWIDKPGASGTLIAPTWVLTAAHFMSAGRPRAGDVVRFGDREFAIKQVIIHPEYSKRPCADLALLELTEPAEGITPIPFNHANEELQQPCTLVGYGWSGVVHPGVVHPGVDPANTTEVFVPVRRAGTNTIARLTDEMLFTRIAAGSKQTSPTQDAALGLGDSGGPLLVERDGGFVIVGVVSGYDLGTEKDLLGRKDSEDKYIRVSKFANWIADTTGVLLGATRDASPILWLGGVAIAAFVVAIVVWRRR